MPGSGSLDGKAPAHEGVFELACYIAFWMLSKFFSFKASNQTHRRIFPVRPFSFCNRLPARLMQSSDNQNQRANVVDPRQGSELAKILPTAWRGYQCVALLDRAVFLVFPVDREAPDGWQLGVVEPRGAAYFEVWLIWVWRHPCARFSTIPAWHERIFIYAFSQPFLRHCLRHLTSSQCSSSYAHYN